MNRLTLGKMQNPVRGFLHGAGAVAALIGLFALIRRAQGSWPALTGSVVFGTALFVMYTISSLYHSVPWSPRWKERIQRIDHSMIFLVVAGTFTPIAIASLEGALLILALSMTWAIAATGIALKAVLPHVGTRLSVALQLIMGWSALVWLPMINQRLGTTAVALIGLGGLFYTVGVVIFVTKRPRLFPRSFSYHELFHVLVIAGSAVHFFAILRYALPVIS